MIRLLLADDHVLMRAGLRQLLATVPDIDVVGEATDGEQAVELALALRPDVVLMDLSMPGVDGIEATRRIVAAAPGIRVVGLTSFSDRERIVAMVDAGAKGYLLKDVDPDELVRGVRAAFRGESPLAAIAASVLLRARTGGPGSSPQGLTDREREVLALLATGMSNRSIATTLGISEATVKVHLTHIYQALAVGNRTAAALHAHRLGLAARPA
jgi:DNA-binding NarL/FixJ family response regulator